MEKQSLALAITALLAVFSAGAILFFMQFLGDEAKSAVPFGGHTLPIGLDYIWANRMAVFFLIVSCTLFAHTTARATQQIVRWKVGD